MVCVVVCQHDRKPLLLERAEDIVGVAAGAENFRFVAGYGLYFDASGEKLDADGDMAGFDVR